MALKDVSLKPLYNSKTDDVISDFYNPVLSQAILYQRTSAYFDSNILKLYAKGITNIVANRGHIFFLFSEQVSGEDFKKMAEGYESREKIFNKLYSEEFSQLEDSVEISNLAFLISHGYLDIKLAFTKKGIYHDKFGLIRDKDDIVYFRGSNNETAASVLNNRESFEVSCSWRCDSNDFEIMNSRISEFERLRNNKEEDTVVLDIPNVIKANILKYDKGRIMINDFYSDDSIILDYYDNTLVLKNNLSEMNNGFNDFSENSFFMSTLEFDLDSGKYDKNNFLLFKKSLHYSDIKRVIEKINKKCEQKEINLIVSPSLVDYLEKFNIQIEKRSSLGIAIKNKANQTVISEFETFKLFVNNHMERELKEDQMWSAFHLVQMKRAANFSVPGSGKTSIVYGAFAYLYFKNIVNKLVVFCPLNAFSSRKDEFYLNFGDKLKLRLYDFKAETKGLQTYEKYDSIVFSSADCNLVLFNYHSLLRNKDSIKEVIDERTFIVFDEVHRLKNPDGVLSNLALEIINKAVYRAVLSGTPIPNGYVDLMVLLKILFSEDYKDYFSYTIDYLRNANFNTNYSKQINNTIFPYFMRLTKSQLKVPKAEPDHQVIVEANDNEKEVIRILYSHYSNKFLPLYIKLMQASTNPSYLLSSLTKDDYDAFNTYEDEDFYTENKLNDYEVTFDENEINVISNCSFTEKFEKGIELIRNLSHNGPVIVWCVFIKTIFECSKRLNALGISNEYVYGGTKLEDRDKMLTKFKNKEISVLITNPHTLGESISLHKVCHQAVYLEYDFNLVHFSQSKDRIHRLGLSENEKTNYYFMELQTNDVLYNFIDDKIYNKLKDKEILENEAVESTHIIYVPNDFDKDIADLFNTHKM